MAKKTIKERIMDFMHEQRTADGDARCYTASDMNQLVGAANLDDVYNPCLALVRERQLEFAGWGPKSPPGNIGMHNQCFKIAYRAWLTWTVKQRVKEEVIAREKFGAPILEDEDFEV